MCRRLKQRTNNVHHSSFGVEYSAIRHDIFLVLLLLLLLLLSILYTPQRDSIHCFVFQKRKSRKYYSSRSQSVYGVLQIMTNSFWNAPASNHGSCVHRNKYLVKDNGYNYHESLQACLIKVIGHSCYLVTSWARSHSCSRAGSFVSWRTQFFLLKVECEVS